MHKQTNPGKNITSLAEVINIYFKQKMTTNKRFKGHFKGKHKHLENANLPKACIIFLNGLIISKLENLNL